MRALGQHYEQHAADFLTEKGLSIITQNYHCKMGEIDLIAKDEKTLVFVEVKFRTNTRFGTALEQITASKIRKIKLCASRYLMQYNSTPACRFDVIAIESSQGTLSLDWIKNAF